MLLSPDRTGFPLLVVPEVELEVQLLPVTKIQFEPFIGTAAQLDSAWYRDKLLSINPRISLQDFTTKNREQLFVSGILPEEIQAFAQWMGEDFDLPTFDEWRTIYTALQRQRFPESNMFFEWATEPVGAILKKLLDQLPARFVQDVSLMRGGLVEWVRQGERWVGLGAPRPEFHPNLWDPRRNHVRPLHLNQRLAYFGFRLVRRGQWDVANKPGGIYIF